MQKRLADVTGQRFGRLVVLGRSTKKTKRTYLLVRCDCGREKEVSGSSLTLGLTQSCGCLNREVFNETRKVRYLPLGRSSRNSMLHMLKYSAAKRGHEWSIPDSLFDELTQSPCHYCGAPPFTEYTVTGGRGKFVYNGIDRKDNTLGYIPGNVLPCCKVCNRAKFQMEYQEFLKYLSFICQKSGICWQKLSTEPHL